ncbi:MAG: hypothetical protein HY898_14260 [Deltaproteobacteria bacterium]|nr:hypothetical protein [Deltaproteobacteria bacterium]
MSLASAAKLLFVLVTLAACTSKPSSPSAVPANAADAAPPSAPPAAVGGGCEYRKYAGKCTVTAVGEKSTFTFEGTVEGSAVKAEGNEVETPTRQTFGKLEVGASEPCTLEFISRGTCTPCMLSHGSCGKVAWDAFRAHPR